MCTAVLCCDGVDVTSSLLDNCWHYNICICYSVNFNGTFLEMSGGMFVQDWIVLIIGPFLGRLDQEMAAYHSAYKW
jgi:hypothetical protein